MKKSEILKENFNKYILQSQNLFKEKVKQEERP